MQLVLDTHGLMVGKRNGCFHIKSKTHTRSISPLKVSSIAVASYCVLSTSAIMLAVEHQIPIYFLDTMGQVSARLGAASYGNHATLRRQQVHFVHVVGALKWCKTLFVLKTTEQLQNVALLRSRRSRFGEEIQPLQNAIERELSALRSTYHLDLEQARGQLASQEAIMARYYWQILAMTLPAPFDFDGRSRRPAQDNFNAALNYCYGMLYGMVETAIFSVGLDPYLGIWHADQYNKPTLSYDLIEPFRPWMDALLIGQVLDGQLTDDMFEHKDNGVWVAKKGKRYIIPLFHAYMNQRCAFRENITTRRNHIYRLAGQLKETIQHSSNT
ncbi:CRISPR-associated endonuclease Cas1 [Runella zeae]|uniref:CRISPR-associated endonuclease Cas1 n=1 Tax=Runella zeae TaxID=94255 RepID=UPI00041356AD|nr:CRISPR-associated endonuclease Cas1 [Runella zeae]